MEMVLGVVLVVVMQVVLVDVVVLVWMLLEICQMDDATHLQSPDAGRRCSSCGA